MKQLLVFSAFFAVFSISAQEVEQHNHGTFPQRMPFAQLFKIGERCHFNILQTETEERFSVNSDTLDFNVVSLGRISDATQQIVTVQDSITHYQVETNSAITTKQLIEQSVIDYGNPRIATNDGLETFYTWIVESSNGKVGSYKLIVNREKSHGILQGNLR